MATESPQATDASVSPPTQTGFYMQTFGSFVHKFNLGGTTALEKLNLDTNRDADGVELTESAMRKGNIEKSRQAKAYFFTQEKQKRLEDKLKTLSPEEQEKLQTAS